MTLARWFSGHSFKLEAEDFILHIPQRSFPNFGLKILLCFVFSKKSLEFLFFLILFSAGIYLQKIGENVLKMELIETTSYLSKARILTNKALVLIFFRGLCFTCKTYNLSIKAENYQSDYSVSQM